MEINDKTLDEILNICQLWNHRELSSNQAMSKIWNLFYDENIKIHNEKRKSLKLI
ncbi:MAG: hypothetical protein ACFFCM_07505 [Promethearchaeota archaeon]